MAQICPFSKIAVMETYRVPAKPGSGTYGLAIFVCLFVASVVGPMVKASGQDIEMVVAAGLISGLIAAGAVIGFAKEMITSRQSLRCPNCKAKRVEE